MHSEMTRETGSTATETGRLRYCIRGASMCSCSALSGGSARRLASLAEEESLASWLISILDIRQRRHNVSVIAQEKSVSSGGGQRQTQPLDTNGFRSGVGGMRCMKLTYQLEKDGRMASVTCIAWEMCRKSWLDTNGELQTGDATEKLSSQMLAYRCAVVVDYSTGWQYPGPRYVFGPSNMTKVAQ